MSVKVFTYSNMLICLPFHQYQTENKGYCSIFDRLADCGNYFQNSDHVLSVDWGGIQALVKPVHVTRGAVEAIAVVSNQRSQLEKLFALADMGLPVRMIYASATATISVAAIERAVTIDISVKPSLSLSLKLQVVLEVKHHSMSPEECTNFEVVCFGL
ncbi:hypothetical protein NA56DRAFT_711448 [Hyaloscypha hepaticicola]|uniref:Uncharacterized protein n=1 Tax=Hyaloscypha hepaticicola TaxID=2082293 RepID=A0A2J6PJB5_9HELO|nr:hypothetical protein NA56DRAFT_711448 [Hyaloscypha hepaticicola]